MKQQHDEEDRRLIQIQEKLFADGDLHGNGSTDRSFRYRMRGDLQDIDWSKFVGTEFVAQDVENDDVEVDLELKKRQGELMRWKMEIEKEQVGFWIIEDGGGSPKNWGTRGRSGGYFL